jgi:hypothetical protein
MKEITRRLYTKPVMFGIAFLLGTFLLVGLMVTTSSEASPSTFIPAGDDKFETTNNGETYHNFAASPIPEDFFGPGSQPYSGIVPLEGVPIRGEGDIDTIVRRNQDLLTPGSTPITMTALSLKSINPITVTYSGGSPESWNVSVGLSIFKASTGTMAISSGGTFDSSLKVWPRFTFTKGAETRVLDTGAPSGSGLMAAQTTEQEDVVFEPAPAPTVAPAPCHHVNPDFEAQLKTTSSATTSATSAGSCAPVTLTSTNSPWQICFGGGFCIPRPITEQELLASHMASPPGTKKAAAQVNAGASSQ